MAYSYQEMMHTSIHTIYNPLWPFRSVWLKKSKFLKKKVLADVIILHQCTKNHMTFNSQNLMWIALQVILGNLYLLPNFWLKK